MGKAWKFTTIKISVSQKTFGLSCIHHSLFQMLILTNYSAIYKVGAGNTILVSAQFEAASSEDNLKLL